MAQLEMLNSQSAAMARFKSESAYKTISEVSDEIDVPQHVLRFWESRFPQVKPSRMRGDRRYYRPEDVETLKKIKTLLYAEGYTIEGAKKVVGGKKPAVMHAPKPPAPPTPKKEATADVKTVVSELRALKKMLSAALDG